MRFTPKSEREIQEERFPVLKPGKYRFEITDAQEQVSKKGNPMIVLKLKILDDGLNVLTYLNDYLMESLAHKLRHAAYACGLGDCYEAGELTAGIFIGKSGVLDLVIQKDKTGQYPDRNSVQDYVKDEHSSSSSSPSAHQQQQQHGKWDDLGEPPEWVK